MCVDAVGGAGQQCDIILARNDLEIIGKYEPMITKAAWSIFGDSYRFRQAYNEYKRNRMEKEKLNGQMSLFDYEYEGDIWA